jgi:apolipoprotein N-acyltransferase
MPIADDSPVLVEIADTAEAMSADLLFGAPGRVDLLVGNVFFNSFFAIRNRTVLARYDKVALMPFSESNPLRGIAEIPGDDYRAGQSRRPLSSHAGSLGVLLCSESMFGAHAREAVREGAEVLVNAANDSWFASEAAARMQLDMSVLRAVETRRFVLRPTLTGYTAVIDPRGVITDLAPFGTPEWIVSEVRPSRAATGYLLWGDAPAVCALLFLIGWSGFAGLRERGGLAVHAQPGGWN